VKKKQNVVADPVQLPNQLLQLVMMVKIIRLNKVNRNRLHPVRVLVETMIRLISNKQKKYYMGAHMGSHIIYTKLQTFRI
jgi:hypothetical protein